MHTYIHTYIHRLQGGWHGSSNKNLDLWPAKWVAQVQAKECLFWPQASLFLLLYPQLCGQSIPALVKIAITCVVYVSNSRFIKFGSACILGLGSQSCSAISDQHVFFFLSLSRPDLILVILPLSLSQHIAQHAKLLSPSFFFFFFFSLYLHDDKLNFKKSLSSSPSNCHHCLCWAPLFHHHFSQLLFPFHLLTIKREKKKY